ncbi:MAG: hypothetical protein WDN49_25110 [Acetobacteraceae bacterium]
MIGRKLTLYEYGYLVEYCSRDLASLTPRAEAWAEKLAAMQRWYAARGRLFVYVLTPSKAGTYPGDIPPGWPCPASQADRDGMLPMYRAALQRNGVTTVDGPALLEAAKAHYPFALFPRGGTHWNWVGAALATQALIRVIDAARPGALPPFTFTWSDAPPVDTDRDLTNLLNMPFPRLDYRAPAVALQAAAPAAARHRGGGRQLHLPPGLPIGAAALPALHRVLHLLPA